MSGPIRPSTSLHLTVTVLLLTGTLGATRLLSHRPPQDLAQPLDTISRQISGFTGRDNPPVTQAVMRSLLSDSYLSRTYTKSDLQADVFIAFYKQQRSGESMHSPKHCLPGAGWEIWNYGRTTVGPNAESINKYSISREGTRMLVLYWYQSKERIIASEYLGKVLLARDALMQNSTSGSIVRIIVPDEPRALDEARAFAGELIPQVQRCFGR
jgi:EpsI family protein